MATLIKNKTNSAFHTPFGEFGPGALKSYHVGGPALKKLLDYFNTKLEIFEVSDSLAVTPAVVKAVTPVVPVAPVAPAPKAVEVVIPPKVEEVKPAVVEKTVVAEKPIVEEKPVEEKTKKVKEKPVYVSGGVVPDAETKGSPTA